MSISSPAHTPASSDITHHDADNDPDTPNWCDSVDISTELDATLVAYKTFAPFYEVGRKMSAAYVAGGPKAGNATMPEFDDSRWNSITMSCGSIRTSSSSSNCDSMAVVMSFVFPTRRMTSATLTMRPDNGDGMTTTRDG